MKQGRKECYEERKGVKKDVKEGRKVVMKEEILILICATCTSLVTHSHCMGCHYFHCPPSILAFRAVLTDYSPSHSHRPSPFTHLGILII
jgi:hypothetical protein